MDQHRTNTRSRSVEAIADETQPRITTMDNSTKINMALVDQTLLAKARKARFDDLPNFSGYPSEDAEKFLKNIKNLTKPIDGTNHYVSIEIVRGKLTQSAGTWFDNNEANFNSWSDFENAFRNRYFSTQLTQQKFDKLKQRKQQIDESLTTYFDDIVNLCHETDANMSEQMIIQHLLSGLNRKLKKEVLRHEKSLKSLHDFFNICKIEQDLQDTYSEEEYPPAEMKNSFYIDKQTNGHSITAATKRINNHNYSEQEEQKSRRNQSSHLWSNSTTQAEQRTSQNDHKFNQHKSTINRKIFERSNDQVERFTPCRICNRANHRTIDCYFKQHEGCFNCGQNHFVRHCTLPPHFQ